MLKINIKEFKEVLNIYMMSGVSEITDCVFKFEEEEFQVASFNHIKSASGKLVVNKEFFSEYEAIGNVGIDNVSEFISILSKFKKEVECKIEGNLLTLTEGKKSVEVPLIDENCIEETYKEITLEYENEFIISVGTLQEMFESKSTKGMKDTAIDFVTEEGKLNIVVKGKYKFKHEYDFEDITKPSVSKFGLTFFDAISKLVVGNKHPEEILKFCIGNQIPMMVLKSGEHYEIEILIAPYGGDEE